MNTNQTEKLTRISATAGTKTVHSVIVREDGTGDATILCSVTVPLSRITRTDAPVTCKRCAKR